jgi:hypothetical protein
VVGEGLLDQPVFAVDVGQGHGSWLSLGSFAVGRFRNSAR